MFAKFSLPPVPAGLTVGAAVRKVASEPGLVFEHDADRVLRSASAAKLVVLLAVAYAIETRELAATTLIDRRVLTPVGYAGLWHRLDQDVLAVNDLARLVGTVSDNLATNGLITALGGVDRVQVIAERYGVQNVWLHDLVQQKRVPGVHPPVFSTGTAAGYADLLAVAWTRRMAGDAVYERVFEWLRDSVDLGLVGNELGLDTLSHHDSDRGVRLFNKTGSDTGVRADCGVITANEITHAYAILVNWTPESDLDPLRDVAIDYMRACGTALRQLANR